MPSVGADHQIGADRERTLRRGCPKAGDTAAFLDQLFRLRLHAQIEGFVAFAVLCQKIEEVPLRHQRDIFAVRRQVGEIGYPDAIAADLGAEFLDLLVRHFEKFIEQAELVHQLERRWVHGVAAEIAKEIGMLFQHHDVDARARQQEAQHHPGRPAASDGALGSDRRIRHFDYLRANTP